MASNNGSGRKRMRVWGILACALACACVLALPVVAHAATVINVTTTTDKVDIDASTIADLGTGGPDGLVSLREAVRALRSEAADVDIVLAAGQTYALEGPGTDVSVGLGVPVYAGSLDVTRPIQGTVRILGNGATIGPRLPATAFDRILDLRFTALTGTFAFEVSNAALSNGTAVGAVGGGAIRAGGDLAPTALTLTGCALTGNRALRQDAPATSGGALSIGAGVDLRLTGCTLASNAASGGVGGAVYVAESGVRATTISGCTFTGNTSDGTTVTAGQGGAVYARSGSAGSSITTSTFAGNTAMSAGVAGPDQGGALFVGGTWAIHDNRFFGNTADEAVGAFGFLDLPNAEFNWWATNADPVSSIPTAVVSVDATPSNRLVLTPGSAAIMAGAATPLSATVATAGHVPPVQGLGVTFGSDALGAVSPGSDTFDAGLAHSGFTAGAAGGRSIASATFDGVVATAAIDVLHAPERLGARDVTFTVGAARTETFTVTGWLLPSFRVTGALPGGIALANRGSVGATTAACTIAGTATAGTGGRYPVTLVATNGIAPDASAAMTVTVLEAPALRMPAEVTMTIGVPVSIDVSATGFPVPALSQTDGLPDGVTFTDNGDGTARIAGTPTSPVGNATGMRLRIVASNGVGSDAAGFLQAWVLHGPDTFTARDITVTAGLATIQSFRAYGYPAPVLALSGVLPAGLTFTTTTPGVRASEATAVLFGVPAAGTGGVYPLRMTADNGIGAGLATDTRLTVLEAPGVTAPLETTITGGDPASIVVTSSGFPTAALTVSGALPAGMTFTDNGDGTGAFGGTPNRRADGVYPLRITADNALTPASSLDITITVLRGVPPWAQRTFTWDLQEDFEHNANTTGATTTIGGVARTDPIPGNVALTAITTIAAGDNHTVGLRADGTVVAVGANTHGQCDVSTWTSMTAVSGGGRHTVGLRTDGTVVAVGDNTLGQCDVSGWTDIVAVAAGLYHTVGLRSDGTVVAAGNNGNGQCNVSGWTGITAIAAGGYHSAGIRADGSAVAVGYNGHGECAVSTWTSATAVAAGLYHTVGLRSDGTVLATGWNIVGQSNVATWTGVTGVAAGGFHTLGVRSDGGVVAAGDNWWGGGSTVATWTGVRAIAVGNAHSAGLSADGLLGAGSNTFGQLDFAPFHAVGTIGGSGAAVGLRAVADADGFAGWDSIVSSASPLASGHAVKYGVRLSGDGLIWSDVLGRDGLPIDWTTGSGNYLGLVGGQAPRTDMSGLPHARYIDVVVRLESAGGAVRLDGVTVRHMRDDAIAPTVTDDAPAGWVRGDVTVTVTATDAVSGVTSMTCLAAGPGSPMPAITTETAVTRVTAEGTTTLTFSAADDAGNRAAMRSVDVRLDKTAPGLAILGTPSAVSLDASDAVSGLGPVWYQVDGGAAQIYNGTAIDPGGSGVHIVTAWVFDVAGNLTVRTREVTVDAEAPVVSDDAPAGWVTHPATVTITARDRFSGVSSIDYVLGGAGGPGGASVASGTAAVPVTAEGTTTITYTASDTAGNTSAVQTATVRVDTGAPSSAASCAAGWQTGPVSVTLTASDAVSGVDSIWYRTTPAGAWQLYGGSFQVTGDGTTTVTYWATDVAGNSEAPKTATVTIDTGAPDVWSDAPSGWRTADVVVHLSASDAVSGVASLSCFVDGPGGTLASSVSGAAMNVHVSDEGTTTVEFSALDAAGTRCTTQTATVRLDKTAPMTTATHTAGWSGGPVTVTLSPADAVSGVASTWYRVGAGGTQPYGAPFAVPATGETTVTYWSVDVAGNVEGERTTVVRVDGAAPTVRDDAPSGWQTAAVDVTLSAEDALSGVASLDWTLGGASAGSGSAAATEAHVPITAEGTSTITYSAVDRAGNRSGDGLATVRIDMTDPSTTASHTAGWSNTPVRVELDATDALSGVATTWYRIGAGGATLYTGGFDIATPGQTTIAYWSVDRAGNTEGEQSTTVSYDGIAPRTSAEASATYLTNSGAIIRLTPTDADSDVAWTRWSIDGSAAVAGTSVPVPAGVGSYVLTFASADLAGNVEDTRQVSFDVVAKTVVRLGGDDRYNVAALAARTAWDPAGDGTWPGVAHVIIACGENGKEADPLSAAGVAGVYDAPILLTTSARVPLSTRAALIEIAAANPGVRIHLVGGPASVPDARFAEIRRFPGVDPTLDRLGGVDRFAVSANVARRMVSVVGTDAIGGVLLYNGESTGAFFDALAVSPIAFRQHMPMLAVRAGVVPPAIAPVLASLRGAGKSVHAASGPGWIGAVPAAGASRLTTSADLFRAAADIATTATAQGWLANAECGVAAKLPDALTGGTFAGKRAGVLLYTDSRPALKPVTAAYLTAHRSEIVRGWIFGGIVSVKPSTHTQFKDVIQ